MPYRSGKDGPAVKRYLTVLFWIAALACMAILAVVLVKPIFN
ncbi:hypothetical protein GJW-30_1_03033 [Variibacter gotjawalensis]|uniref:Uncharacterized protein n=1 Tax=Variibacter gotjawalensis TaxID=1333996 RepID=A0A0S3PX36_9BRAD|nr:hypothetical protein [Variibacter gotjawalensis]RZS48230.1 hypothetical protein EV661_0635 [Variibacter gotjawalensis]BAT60489.1 hypothetical protein GJW-30_1_03033 [Variibacter gotjawalensis]